MGILYLIVAFIASCIGAISGIGGGVIIKPVLDLAGFHTVTQISFLSGCTVLTMSIVALLRNRKSEAVLDVKRTTFLGIGAAIGGISGKYLFDLVKQLMGNENVVGFIQSALLFVITGAVLVFVCFKDRIKMMNIQSNIISILIGLLLGVTSSFLGIGGGPINIAVMYLFFSMSPKTAALNSIYVIMLSQSASLIFTVGTKTVPQFEIIVLLLMMLGGVLGAITGSIVVKKISQKQVDLFFRWLMGAIMAINVFNMIMFL